MLAAHSLGGTPVPLYQDAVATEMTYVLQDAEIAFAFAEDQEQVDKLLEIADDIPALRHIIYLDPRGMRGYNDPRLCLIDDLLEQGRAFNQEQPEFFNNQVALGKSSDVSVILYTSGTTGKPKGVCQTHASMIGAGRGACEVDGLSPADSVMAYLPMAWVGDFLFSMAQGLTSGFTVNCPEARETVSPCAIENKKSPTHAMGR